MTLALIDEIGLSSPSYNISLSFTQSSTVQSDISAPNTTQTTKLDGIKFAEYNFTTPPSGVVPKTPVISILSIKNSGLVTIGFSQALINSSAAYIQNSTTTTNG